MLDEALVKSPRSLFARQEEIDIELRSRGVGSQT